MLSRSKVETFARKLVGGTAESLHARVKQMRNAGFPFGVNVDGSGRTRSIYDLDAVMLVGVTMVITKLGVSVNRAMEITRDGLFEIRDAYSDVGATALAVTDAPPRPKGWLVVEQFELDGRERARFDTAEHFALPSLGTISGAAIVINVRAIWDAMIETVGRDDASVVSQLAKVRHAIASGDAAADGDLSDVLREPS